MSNPGELRHILTVEHVGVLLTQAGVPRSRRQIIRYCQTGLLDAVKIPGPTGDQWYVAPASLPKAIGDLKQWEAQREGQGMTQLDMSNSVHPMSDHVHPEISRNSNSDTARPSAPKLATSDLENGSAATETKPDMARRGAPEPDMSNSDGGPNSEKTELVVPGHSETQPATASYVAQLEKRIEEKDDFIGLLKGQLTAKDEQISELSTRYRETHTLLGAMQRMFAPLLGQADPYQPADHRDARVDNSPPAGN
ncbi:hypothetical protein [Hyphomicrobium sp.]|uniref:hypothetical protein n=1 Tax=Hyphomicrobium sp. TaxID=82 RepID=UPI002E34E081|nr:hypothetical protein [Hyphomicrobium sp.]HEX2841361.1 hypothetical protein [Hyphomicrobium sp.]